MSKKLASNSIKLLDYISKAYPAEKFSGRLNTIMSEKDRYVKSMTAIQNDHDIEKFAKASYNELQKVGSEEKPILLKTEEFINEVFSLKAIKESTPPVVHIIDQDSPKEQAQKMLDIIKEKETEQQREKAMISYAADKMLIEAVSMLKSINDLQKTLINDIKNIREQVEKNEEYVGKIKKSLIDPVLRKFDIKIEDLEKNTVAKGNTKKEGITNRTLKPLEFPDDLSGQTLMNFDDPNKPHIVGDNNVDDIDVVESQESDVVEEIEEELCMDDYMEEVGEELDLDDDFNDEIDDDLVDDENL